MQRANMVDKACEHTTITASCPDCAAYERALAESGAGEPHAPENLRQGTSRASAPASPRSGTTTQRGAIPSIKLLRQRSSKKQSEQLWNRLIRKVSIYVTWLLLHTPISANGVTFLFLFAGLVGGGIYAIGTRWAWIIGTLWIWLSIVFDFSDGEVARFRQQSSWFGDYFEETVHAVLLVAMYGGISYGVWRHAPASPWPFAAALVALGLTMIIRNDKNLLLKSKLYYYGAARFVELMAKSSATDLRVTRNMSKFLYYIDMVIFDFGFYLIVLPIAALANRMDLLLYFAAATRVIATAYLFLQVWKQR